MTYRWLPADEWTRLEPLFAAYGGVLPSPMVAQIAVAEDGYEIVGFFVLQMTAHAEPLWVHPEHRGTEVVHELIKRIYDVNVPCYAFSDSERVNDLAAANGMTRLPWTTMWFLDRRE